ncbi:MAG: hypothetical protein AAB664_04525, partial [Patescibacteria group bacterium]
TGTPGLCGNNNLDPKEECDNGASNSDDAGAVCTTKCLLKNLSQKNICVKVNSEQIKTEDGSPESPAIGIKRLSQIFAKSLSLYEFNDKKNVIGEYFSDGKSGSWNFDDRAKGNNGASPSAPVIVSLGNCQEGKCKEKNPGFFTINGQDQGEIIADKGTKHVTAQFFVYANPEQMPLRKIFIDWGKDDFNALGKTWEVGALGGSSAPSNYYKNRRGLDKDNNPFCDDKSSFGQTADACTTSYLTFSNDYVCTSADVINGRACAKVGDKEMYPCVDQGYCVFKPRVYAEDNWGWCAGTCTVNSKEGDSTNGCFGTGPGSPYECDYQNCPGGENCLDTKDIKNDPWINFAGTIKIKPE